MTGDADDPYVSFDGLRFKEDIKKKKLSLNEKWDT